MDACWIGALAKAKRKGQRVLTVGGLSCPFGMNDRGEWNNYMSGPSSVDCAKVDALQLRRYEAR
jgi:hypothetical protein